jgi:hypothetical protein
MTRILAVVALLAAASPALAADIVAVMSADQKLIFIPGKGQIEALDLASGKIQWSNKSATRLAGASGGAVFAWVAEEKANAFRVFAFDGEMGRVLGKSDPIELPEGFTTEKGEGRSLAVAARGDGEAALVAWRASAAKKDASGVVAVLFAKGRVTVAKDKSADDIFKAAAPKTGDPKSGFSFRVEEQQPKGGKGMPKVMLVVVKDGKDHWSKELPGTVISNQ